jgi:hypothetical protein
MINLDILETLPKWLITVIACGTLGIMIGAIFYSGYIMRKYKLSKNPFDLMNITAGMLSWMLVSPYIYGVIIGIVCFVVLVIRNIIIIRKPIPIFFMILLTLGSFFNLLWLIGWTIIRRK